MATIFRRLLAPNRNNEQLLVFIIKHSNGLRLDYSSGVRLHSKFWNKLYLVKRNHNSYSLINDQIKSIELQILIIINKIISGEEEITSNSLKRKLNLHFQRRYKDVNNTNISRRSFYGFCDLYIIHSQTTKKKATIEVYQLTIKILKSYNSKLDYNDFTLDFYSDFISYLRTDFNLLDSTIGKHIKNLKAILNEATEQGYNTNLAFKSKRFKTFREEADSIFLNKTELNQIAELDLSYRKGLERVRDLFQIGCNTGLRFSDLGHLTKANIIVRDTGQYILIRIQKTEKQVMIPINTEVKTIIEKYNGEIPPAISNQKMNKALKEIGKLAGLNSLIQITKKRAGVLEKHNFKKYELITTHTARRSFATNAYLSGVPALAIMKITGHKSESSFMKYIKGSQEENAHTLAQHPLLPLIINLKI